MENTRRKKRRSNSFRINNNNDLESSNKNSNESNDKRFHKSKNVKKIKMIKSLKQIQNIDKTTYDYIFVGRTINGTTIDDFNSFLQLLKTIKYKYNPKLLKSNDDIENIKKEGKFSLNNSGITNLILFNDKHLQNIEISINSRYIKSLDLKNKFINFYATKSFFKGKHCFELEILNMKEPHLAYGLIDISYIYKFKKDYNKDSFFNIRDLEIALERKLIDKKWIQIFKLSDPIFFERNKKYYNHFIKYGDVLGLCYDLDNKIINLFINGEIRETHIINIEKGNFSFVPIISIGSFTEVLFNSGENLKYEKNYQNCGFGFIPLDEKGKNNYEKSKLKNATDEYIDILVNNGISVINNKNVTYSDINEIYHIIYDFLGKISFNHSYIIQKSFIEPFLESNIELTDKEMEKCYIFFKYILNCSNNKKNILKNIFFTLAENIHIFMIKGKIKYISNISKLINLFFYIFKKKEILNIFLEIKKTTIKLFKSIFISFHISYTSLEINSLDFLVNNNFILDSHLNNNANNEINNNNCIFIPNILFAETKIKNEIFQSQLNLQNSYGIISNFFKEFLILLFNNGTDSQNKKIFKIFKKFLENQIHEMFKFTFCKMTYNFNDIFKNIFLPAMALFNQEYNKNKKFISIKKFLAKNLVDEEKIGGTVNHIYENFAIEIPNFQELLKENINNYNNVFFIEFIYFFFISEDSVHVWKSLNYFITKYLIYSDDSFWYFLKSKSFDQINFELDEYIYFKLFLFNLNDLDIFVQFLYNFSDFILNELYPKKLIYFLPEKIVITMKKVLDFLNDSIVLLKKTSDKLSEIKNEKKKSFFEEKSKLNQKIFELAELCWKNYLSIFIKIIKDENITKLNLKSEIAIKIKSDIYMDTYFTDDDIYSIFNFITIIRNNDIYKHYSNKFMQIFEGEITSKKNKYYKFGLRIEQIIKTNQDFLKLLLILIYDNMNSNLSTLEEKFCEYNLEPKSNQIQNNNNINNDVNNNDGNNDLINSSQNSQDSNNINDYLNEMHNLFSFIGRRLINAELSNKEKLYLLENTFKETNYQFLILNNFYRISVYIKQLYEINTFEGKYLNNLLSSIYSIIFSSNNISKILDNNNTKINNKYYKVLITSIYSFYSIIINNILNQKDDNLLKEIAKQRNVFHFRDILNFYEKYNPIKIDKKEDPYYFLKTFIEILEKIIPEEDTVKPIIINNNWKESTVNGKKNGRDICPICDDSIIDTHILPCEHSICRNCLVRLTDNKCPFCRNKIEGIKEDPNFKI